MLALLIVGGCVITLSMVSFIPFLQPINKTAIILVSTILFFVFKILDLNDLEALPWNIILLFAGAMSIGFCLWETGAAEWLAINWLVFFQNAHWFIFIMAISVLVLMMTNFIMNVAAIAIYSACCTSYCTLSQRSFRSNSFCLISGSRHAFSLACWCCTKCYCLRFKAVYFR